MKRLERITCIIVRCPPHIKSFPLGSSVGSLKIIGSQQEESIRKPLARLVF